jgi:hypothetical protein
LGTSATKLFAFCERLSALTLPYFGFRFNTTATNAGIFNGCIGVFGEALGHWFNATGEVILAGIRDLSGCKNSLRYVASFALNNRAWRPNARAVFEVGALVSHELV